MFQVNNEEAKGTNENVMDVGMLKKICKEVFKIQNIIIYILTFFISMVSIKNEVLPFGLAVIAACLGTEIPILMVFLLSCLSIIIFQSGNSFGEYFFTCVVFFLSTIIIKPKYTIEDRNEIVRVGGKLFWACFIVNLINNFRGGFLIYNLFIDTIISALTYSFYKVFVNGIVVFRDFNVKKAFSLEELIGASIIIGVASTAFSGVTLWGISTTNIIIIFLILVLGWKNGMLLGGVAGVSLGLAVTLVSNVTPIQIAVFSTSGILAGFFNKFGKLGVIIGFILGNAILTYLYSGNIETVICFREILIAALGLVLVPKNVNLNLEDLIGNKNLITDKGEYRLEGKNVVKEKIDVVTSAINDIVKKYQTVEDEICLASLKEKYLEVIAENLNGHEENLFYEDLHANKDEINGDLFIVLEQKDLMSKEDFLEILKLHNNFIEPKGNTVNRDLEEIVNIINKSYKMISIENAKIEEKQKITSKVVNELESVKDIITEINKEEVNVKVENKKTIKEKFLVRCGIAKITKETSDYSGDSSLELKLNDGKCLYAISDGKGTGLKASQTSSIVLKVLKDLTAAGFDKTNTINLINSSLNLDTNDEMYASLDMAIIDSCNGMLYSIKNGASNTYIKTKKSVRIIESKDMPLGIVDKISTNSIDVQLCDGDIVVLASDGVVESKDVTKKDWLEDFLKNVSSTNIQKLADLILAEAVENNFGIVTDDMTVMVIKISNKK